MLRLKTLALVTSLSLLGACSAPEPVVSIEGKPSFGTVKLRISQDNTNSAATPVEDSFVSAVLGATVPVLNADALCPEQSTRPLSVKPGQPCFVSVRFKTVGRNTADLEFVMTTTSDDAALAVASPVQTHLLRDRTVPDVVKVGGYHIDATYLEPLPKEVKLPSADVNLRLIQRPFGLF